MRNMLLLFSGCALLACAPTTPAPTSTFEIVCPLNITTAVYDTVQALRVYHIDNHLTVYQSGLTSTTYPGTCVAKELHGD